MEKNLTPPVENSQDHLYGVLGFVRDDLTGDVLLLRQETKDCPEGCLTGIGGHVENISRDTEHSPYCIGRVAGYRQVTPDHEYPVMSMLRACFEKTGLFISADHWVELGSIGDDNSGYTVFLYGTSWNLDKVRLGQKTDVLVMPRQEAIDHPSLAPPLKEILSAME